MPKDTGPITKGPTRARAPRRAGVGGREPANTPPASLEDCFQGKLDEEGYNPHAAPYVPGQAITPDGDYGGNVVGPQSKPVV